MQINNRNNHAGGNQCIAYGQCTDLTWEIGVQRGKGKDKLSAASVIFDITVGYYDRSKAAARGYDLLEGCRRLGFTIWFGFLVTLQTWRSLVVANLHGLLGASQGETGVP